MRLSPRRVATDDGVTEIYLLEFVVHEMSNAAAPSREYLQIRLGLISRVALCSNVSAVCVYSNSSR